VIKSSELASALAVMVYPVSFEDNNHGAVAGATNLIHSNYSKNSFPGLLPLANDREGELLEAVFLNAYIEDKKMQEELKNWQKIYLENIKENQIYR